MPQIKVTCSESALSALLRRAVWKLTILHFLIVASCVAGGFMMAADASAFDITTAMAGFLGENLNSSRHPWKQTL